jgi:hypothetical protein
VPSESLREQIAQAIEAQLKTIRRPTYWHDVKDDNVSRYLHNLDQALNSANKPLLEVLTGTGDTEHMTTNRRDQEEFEIIIIGYNASDDQEMLRTWNERLVRDVKIALYANVTLGGLARTVHITTTVTDEGELAHRGHAQFEMTLRVEYVYDWTSP